MRSFIRSLITSRDSFPELVFQPVKITLGVLRANVIKS